VGVHGEEEGGVEVVEEGDGGVVTRVGHVGGHEFGVVE